MLAAHARYRKREFGRHVIDRLIVRLSRIRKVGRNYRGDAGIAGCPKQAARR
jgi:hypothetical protein